MDKKRKSIIITVIMAVLLLVLSGWCILKPADEFSDSERRVLAQKPEMTAESIFSTSFMTGFEEYAMDQFPARESFRKLKAFNEFNVFNKKDNNGIYKAEGHLSKIEYPLQYDMLEYAAGKFKYLYDTYMMGKENTVYLSVIPDKNMYLAEPNGFISLDYNELIEYFTEEMDYAKYIDITDTLSLDDYYKTDTHWKQECLVDTAKVLGEGMDADVHSDYDICTLEEPFCGVYTGQYTLPVEPDVISYLTNETLEKCKVTIYDSGMPEESFVYDMEKAHSKDPYEMFLSGTVALMTLENPYGPQDKELIVFRDSFGSSLVPLLAEGYGKITLVDIRYIQSGMLGSFIEFEDQDVLFLYSTSLLNYSMALK
ncbi:MAG: hypothetical protein IKL72_02425 [Firmicutes bacterium]|nr:hypothetical protein [Bacillota bacterium]